MASAPPMDAPPAYNSVMAAPGPIDLNPIMSIQLNFKATNLKNRDTLSKSDPQVWLYMVEENGSETFLGKTEVVKDSLNPEFGYSHILQYKFEEVQTMKFYVVDVDSSSNNRKDHDWLGNATVTVAKIVSSPNAQVTLPLIHENKKSGLGELIVMSEEVNASREIISMKLSARKIDKKDFFGKSDGYLVIKRAREDGSFVAVHKTEVVMNSLDPNWKEFTLPLQILCNGDWKRPLEIECYDWDKNSDPDFIGKASVSMDLLRSANGKGVSNGFPFINEKKQKKKGKKYTNSGTLIVESFHVIEKFTFLDYLKSGYKLNLMVSIDFTASNGDPAFGNSLHANNPYSQNEYQKAIISTANVLLEYDSDKMIAAYGYGAKIPPDFKTNHCFPLAYSHSQVPAVPGLMAAYANALNTLKLYGPTNMAPTIAEAMRLSRESPGEYVVCLIVTDGVISDQDKTVEQLVLASRMPISIVIVGVGSADFTQMEFLDSDDKLLKDFKGNVAARDIVQFVPFRDFSDKPISRLAAHTMAEIPGQFVECMQALKLKPLGM